MARLADEPTADPEIRGFGTARPGVDSLVLHGFRGEEGAAYVESLRAAVKPGGATSPSAPPLGSERKVMPTAAAHIPTERASRYLEQFCRHLGQMSRMRHQPPARHGGGGMPPTVRDVDYSDTCGVIRFDEGQFTLRATSDTLSLRVDADDEDTLQRLQDGITARLEKIGRRDQLMVTWQRCRTPPGPPGEGAGPASAPGTGTSKRPGRGRTIGLMAVGAVVVAVHLGLGGAALAASAWTGWAVNAVMAIILVKVVFVAVHVVLGRVAIRRGKSLRPRWTLRHSRTKSMPATPQTAEVAPGEERT